MGRRSEMFLLLYRQKDIDKIIEGNYQNYVIDKLLVSLCKRNDRQSYILSKFDKSKNFSYSNF